MVISSDIAYQYNVTPIVLEYCITHNRNYRETASIYDVSYSQVYSWVKKCDSNGEDGLTDKRGLHKTDDEVDELERLRRENLRLKRQLLLRVAYYKWFHRKIPDHELENKKLAELINKNVYLEL